jgi:hypothetical protein
MHTPLPRPARTTRQLARIWTALVLLAAVFVMLACMQVTRLEKAPASNLRLEVLFQGGLVSASQVKISVSITTNPNAWVEFAGHQKLTCNGVTIPEKDSGKSSDPPIRTVTIPRQPPGDAYTFVYTDEGGRQTSVVVPAPQADLAVTQPVANARIPIPKTPTPSEEQDPGLPRPESLASEPFQVTYTVPFPKDSLPKTSQDLPEADGVSARVTGTCRKGPLSQCLLSQGLSDATGSVTITDKNLPYGYGFENLAPGAGSVEFGMEVSWYVPDSGFNSFRIRYQDGMSVPVTWVEA